MRGRAASVPRLAERPCSRVWAGGHGRGLVVLPGAVSTAGRCGLGAAGPGTARAGWQRGAAPGAGGLCVPRGGGRQRGRGPCGEPGLTCPRGRGRRRWTKRRWSSCRSPRSWPRRCCRPWRSGAGAALCVTCGAPVSTPGASWLGRRSRTVEGARRCPQRGTAAPRARWPRRRRESSGQPQGSPEGAAWRCGRIGSCSASCARGKGCSCQRPRRRRARVMSCPGPGHREGSGQGRGRAAGGSWSGAAVGAGSGGCGSPAAAGGVTAALTPPSLPPGRAGQLRGPG